MNLADQISVFMGEVGSGAHEIYNEFSLQHELGIFLRACLPTYKIRFERNVSHFKLDKTRLEKREIDIAVLAPNGEPVTAIELKFPRNGQVPESLFGFCKDIAFLEQLVEGGFQSAHFLAVVEHAHFYEGRSDGIYAHFRAGKELSGPITKPTGARDGVVNLAGRYTAHWQTVSGNTKFCLVTVSADRNPTLSPHPS